MPGTVRQKMARTAAVWKRRRDKHGKTLIERRTAVRMNTFEYEVASIDGDYANLRRIDVESDETKLVARALLPPEIMEGTKVRYEMMQYEIIA